MEQNPFDRQVGGNHYKNFKIQPIEFITANKLDFCQGSIIKYICRYEFKNGKEDLEKIKHYVDLLIKAKYPEEFKGSGVPLHFPAPTAPPKLGSIRSVADEESDSDYYNER